MAAVGAISAEEAEQAYQARLELRPPGRRRARRQLLSWTCVLKDLEERYGTDVVHHAGLKVFTTLDPQLQAWAVDAVQDGLARAGPGPERPGAGRRRIPARTRRRRWWRSRPTPERCGRWWAAGTTRETEFNRAVQSNRQPGSGFKPFLYYAAFEKAGAEPGHGLRRPQGGDPDPGPAALDAAELQRRTRGADDPEARAWRTA
ncbi:MAG: hypothetical protein MZV70_19865 [Desulfobacterales bacterium]|nr:hypothetical protein [Desulfobacterales bacterium]